MSLQTATAVAADPVDVVVSLFAATWAEIAFRGFPEDRLAMALNDDRRVERLLVCDPPRSIAGRLKEAVRGARVAEVPLRTGGAVYRPHRLRRTDPPDPRGMVARYEEGMRRSAAAMGMDRPAVITAHPLLAGFGRFDWAGSVTYYAWDDWTASVPHRRWWDAYEESFRRVRETGRRVCAVSEAALRAVAPTGPSRVIPNGVEPTEWASPGAPPDWFAARPAPRMLYIGGLDSRIDVDQVRAVAERFPEGSVTFVGYLLDPDHFTELRALPNVEIFDPLPRSGIPGLVAAADVCLVPHVQNALTEAMSPLKLYEYLAAGRPVAAVALPPIAAVEGRLALVPPGGDFVDAVERALALGPAPEDERLAFVSEHGWSHRFEELLELALAD
jgi:teichuronic acid biosynthesis glycosyltransferase TuaH